MTYNIYTLGCKVNTYESNVIIDIMNNNNYKEVSITDKPDISIINTCTVTNTADNKSLKTIRHAINKNNKAIIIVVGCLTQISVDIVKEIKGVNIILGNKNKSKIPSYINDYLDNKKQIIDIFNLKESSFETMELNNFNKTRAFVKIEDGCNNYCSYCIIPYARGGVRSKTKESVLKEVNDLVSANHKEIVLTGIHTGNYGSDLENYKLFNLLEDLLKIKGLERIRISSIEMNEINDHILELLKNNPKLVNHMHIPIQSGSDEILKKMNRKYNKNEFIDKINNIRNIRPDISITTDVIVGFPYETDELFNETIETIKAIKFSKLHVFPYSKREGTVAASMPNQVGESIKHERVKILLELSKELEIDCMNKFLNKEIEFLPETLKESEIIGHTENYLLIKTNGTKEDLNKIIKVKIVDIKYPYCLAKRINL